MVPVISFGPKVDDLCCKINGMEETPKKKHLESSPSRRDFLKGVLGAGVGVAGVIEGSQLALSGALSVGVGRESFKEYLRPYPTIEMPEDIGGKFVFIGAAHTTENIRANFDELIAAVRGSDLVLLETGDLPTAFYEDRKILDLDEDAFKKRIFDLTEKMLDWHDFIALAAARYEKPVIETDPNTGLFDGVRLREMDIVTGSAEYFAFLTAVAGMALSQSSDEHPTRREALLKFLTAPALAAYVGTKALSGNYLQSRMETLVLPEFLQQHPFGKEVVELSTKNYRDFSSVRGLYALAEVAPGYFKDKNMGAFYGAAHFPIMQILRLPKDLIEAKIGIYRKIDPSIKPRPARIREFDRNATDDSTGEKGAWREVAEVTY